MVAELFAELNDLPLRSRAFRRPKGRFSAMLLLSLSVPPSFIIAFGGVVVVNCSVVPNVTA